MRRMMPRLEISDDWKYLILAIMSTHISYTSTTYVHLEKKRPNENQVTSTRTRHNKKRNGWPS